MNFRKIISALLIAALPACAAAQTINGYVPPTGTGTVTSVGLVAPSIFTSGAPVTTNGSVSFSLNSQAQNSIFAGPTSGSGTPAFRGLVTADVPTGTSGANIPLLNGVNTWSGAQAITQSAATGLTITNTGGSNPALVPINNLNGAWPAIVMQNPSTGSAAQTQLFWERNGADGVLHGWQIAHDVNNNAGWFQLFNLEAFEPSGLPAPTLNAPTTSTTGGALASATYYYKVTTLNNAGETSASNEVSQVTSGSTSTVSLSWNAVSGATSYRVYRGTAAAGENVYYLPGNVTSFTDTGAANTGGTPPGSNTTSGVIATPLSLARSGEVGIDTGVPVAGISLAVSGEIRSQNSGGTSTSGRVSFGTAGTAWIYGDTGAGVISAYVASNPIVTATASGFYPGGASGNLLLGASGSRWNTIYSVAANFSGNATALALNGTGSAVFAPNAAAGTGATFACAASRVCDSLSGTATLTTGTSPTTGTLGLITLPNTRTNAPNCAVNIKGVNGANYTDTESTTAITLTANVALSASTAYTVNYVCGGI